MFKTKLKVMRMNLVGSSCNNNQTTGSNRRQTIHSAPYRQSGPSNYYVCVCVCVCVCACVHGVCVTVCYSALTSLVL